MEEQIVRHYQVNGKYRVQFERSAVKGQDGFKVESNDDSAIKAIDDALELYNKAKAITKVEATL